MAVFRWRHFAGEIILWAVRWYCRYGISYRDLEEMMGERGVAVDHTTVYRWTQRYAPELEKRSAWYRSRLSFSWLMRCAHILDVASCGSKRWPPLSTVEVGSAHYKHMPVWVSLGATCRPCAVFRAVQRGRGCEALFVH